MKKTVVILALVAALAMTGCTSNSEPSSSEVIENSTPSSSDVTSSSEAEDGTVSNEGEISSIFTDLSEETAPEDALAVIVNNFVGTEATTAIEASHTIEVDETGGTIYIAPKFAGSKIVVSTVNAESPEFSAKDEVYSNASTPDGFVLELKSDRPEGIPSHMVEISTGEETIVYYINYNGKDGHKEIEYIVPSETVEQDTTPQADVSENAPVSESSEIETQSSETETQSSETEVQSSEVQSSEVQPESSEVPQS